MSETGNAQYPMLRLYLWPHRIIYLGPSPDNDLHRHHAAQLCVSLDETLRIRRSTRAPWMRQTGVFIPPDQPHQIAADNMRILALYLEPESDEYQALLRPVLDVSSYDLQPLSLMDAALDQLRNLCEVGAEPTSAWSTCTSALGLGIAPAPRVDRDPRVEKVLELIREQPSRPFAAEQLAQAVHLSSSRLSHLFRDDVGVPIRRFIVWSRLRVVISRALDGASLTDAAHAAGFSDASHMSNTFRQVFGFAPSAIFATHIPKDVNIID